MPAATPIYALPYPVPADPADVPADLGALANRIEAVVGPGSTNGQIPVWDNAAKKWVATAPAANELAYAENATASIGGGASEAAAAAIVSLPAVTFDGVTKVSIDFTVVEIAFAATASLIGWFYLFDGGSSLGIIGVARNSASALAIAIPAYFRRELTPSAGSHTYSLRFSQSGGVVTVNAGAGGVGVRMPHTGSIRKMS